MKCKHAAYMREWYRRKSLEERRAWIARRDPEAVRQADLARYERDKPKRLALMRDWAERNPDKVREGQRRYRERYPDKAQAHNMVSNALRDGRLKREPCEVCGTNENVHAHHDDYSRPLDVRWLCQPHHLAHHNAERRQEAA